MNPTHESDLTFRHLRAGDLPPERQRLLDIYAEVYAHALDEPFRSLSAFDRRLSGYAAAPGWECVLGYDGDHPVGFAYGYTLQPGARWWKGLSTDVDPATLEETGNRTFALNDIMVRAPWRGTTVAHRIHDELTTGRPETRVTLTVDETHPKARRRYEEWGYTRLGSIRPDIPDAPVFDCLILTLHP